jgi:hypothetical protein
VVGGAIALGMGNLLLLGGIVYKLSLKTYVGGEARLSWFRLRAPGKDSGADADNQGSQRLKTVERSEHLVNRSDSEEPLYKGVSGFGLLPAPTKFGLPARRQVKRLSSVLDSKSHDPRDTIFFTATLPGSTRASMLALSQWSGHIVHRLKSWCNGVDPTYSAVYVWEWQKRGALHLHMALYVGNPSLRQVIFSGLKGQWISLLEQVSDMAGVDLFARAGGRGTWRGRFDKIKAEAEWVKRSVGAYLGKYMSKAVCPGEEASRYFYPSRWWGSTMNLKREERAARWEDEHICLLSGDANGAYNQFAPMIELLSGWSTSYRHKVSEGETTVGFGASVPILRKLFSQEISMHELEKNPSWLDAIGELERLLDAMEAKRPDWMIGFRNECSAYDRYRSVTEGIGGFGYVSSNDYACIVMAVCQHLNSSVTGGDWHGGGPISYWGIQAVRRVTDSVMNAFNTMGSKTLEESLEKMTVPKACCPALVGVE